VSPGNDQVFIDGGTGNNALIIQQNPDDAVPANSLLGVLQ
jgi:hypothetical protein